MGANIRIANASTVKWTAVILGILVAAAFYAIELNFSHLSQSLFGSQRQASKSTELYEISLRNGFGDRRDGGSQWFSEWSLSVPRAFVSKEIGLNGNINAPPTAQSGRAPSWLGGPKFGDYFVGLHAVLDTTSSSLKTANLATKEQLDKMFLSIELANIGGFAIADEGYCVRQDDMAAFLKQNGWTRGWSNCLETQRRCSIYTDIDHWPVELIVSRDIYAQPDRICQIAREFLSRFTIRRDRY